MSSARLTRDAHKSENRGRHSRKNGGWPRIMNGSAIENGLTTILDIEAIIIIVLHLDASQRSGRGRYHRGHWTSLFYFTRFFRLFSFSRDFSSLFVFTRFFVSFRFHKIFRASLFVFTRFFVCVCDDFTRFFIIFGLFNFVFTRFFVCVWWFHEIFFLLFLAFSISSSRDFSSVWWFHDIFIIFGLHFTFVKYNNQTFFFWRVTNILNFFKKEKKTESTARDPRSNQRRLRWIFVDVEFFSSSLRSSGPAKKPAERTH